MLLLADKKGTEKLVIAAMIKGQIQSKVIEDVQAELDKSDSNTISRTFTFDRKTDIGLIQVGDRYHACVSDDDLRPPEGTECEKEEELNNLTNLIPCQLDKQVILLILITHFLIFHLSNFISFIHCNINYKSNYCLSKSLR